jgi:hypothetical protein
MEPLLINYWAVLVGGVGAMVLGMIWYGPLFGKNWMRLLGVDPKDSTAVQSMQKSAGPLYLLQMVLVLFQVLVLAHLIADTTQVGGLTRALWIAGAFVLPTLAGAVMWSNEKSGRKWERFLIQGGYQILCYVWFGLLLQYWK